MENKYQANYVFLHDTGSVPMEEPYDIIAESDDDAIWIAKERVDNWDDYYDVPVCLVYVSRCNEYWDEVEIIY